MSDNPKYIFHCIEIYNEMYKCMKSIEMSSIGADVILNSGTGITFRSANGPMLGSYMNILVIIIIIIRGIIINDSC